MLANVTLDDKYVLSEGRVYTSGIQALVRLPMLQRDRDARAGLNTAGFISGYRGSPLGNYDSALWQARAHLDAHQIRFQPGLNEDLAATSIWGSQQLDLYPDATVDGVFATWYGKGPGVARSMDVLKHANAAGCSRNGGVLAIVGDDHSCQSSSIPHQSEQDLASAMIPILHPAGVQEFFDFGLAGWALSRFSSCWVGFKTIAETVETAASVTIDPARPRILLPSDFEMPVGGLGIRWPDPPLEQEARLHGPKMDAVAAFARANPFDRIVIEPASPRLGIATTGKTYLDVRQALADLGVDERRAGTLGIRLYKIGLVWPLEAAGARRFADGLREVLVIEEKRPIIEDQVARLLYGVDADRRPGLVGKRGAAGETLLPSAGELTPTIIARAIVQRLSALGPVDTDILERLERMEASAGRGAAPATAMVRLPYFCSGCPHSTSTHVPEGSRATAGIGCHGMVMWMPERRTITTSHMGGEGIGWVGQAPFTTTKHIFQNLGDGTYSHSGLLAVRAAAAAGVNITYKILYNDAVAMTGGQPVETGLSVQQLAQQVIAEGAKRLIVVTDDPDKYAGGEGFPAGIEIRHRDRLDETQRELRDVMGLTILIYDQTCAAEKRRRRKRGTFPDPDQRVFINDAVCEGCGDCSDKSSCISVKPLETELGRKRVIDQSSCNKDFSCLNGFCPSFVTIRGGRLRKPRPAQADANLLIPEPPGRPLDAPYGILATGIGGTGIITVGQILGMAAHLDGIGCTVLDFTGLAQKNGAVMSHIRLAPRQEDLHSARIADGGAALLLACDMVVATSGVALGRIQAGTTRGIINGNVAPTAAFITNNDMDLEGPAMRRALQQAIGADGLDFLDATRFATALMGDAIATNLIMLGYAYQKGLVPISFAALDRAIELNGGPIAANRKAFSWGRLAAHDTAAVEQAAAGASGKAADISTEPLDLQAIVERNVRRLSDYQSSAYAQEYRAFVAEAQAASVDVAGDALATAVARSLFKLMAYKDEYEVARLYTDGNFKRKLEEQFEGEYRLEFNLAPPLLAPRDPVTGQVRKQKYGAWMWGGFKLLAKLRQLRGTPFDIFGYTEERKVERRLIEEFRSTMRAVLVGLEAGNLSTAIALARLPDQIRGYGHVKEANRVRVKQEEARLLETFGRRAPTAVAAE